MKKEDIRYTFFFPRKRDMRHEFPSLAKVEEFKNMKPKLLKFTYYYAIYFNDEKDTIKRVNNSIKYSFLGTFPDSELPFYQKLQFPRDVADAIKKWSEYKFDTRLRMKFINDMIMANWEALININPQKEFIEVGEDGLKRTNWTAKNQYVTMTSKILSEMPTLLKNDEEGYGINESDYKPKDMSEQSFLVEFHKENTYVRD